MTDGQRKRLPKLIARVRRPSELGLNRLSPRGENEDREEDRAPLHHRFCDVCPYVTVRGLRRAPTTPVTDADQITESFDVDDPALTR